MSPSPKMGATMTDHPVERLTGSNSLPELAARIMAEHEAAGVAIKRGLGHAIEAGKLLIEAKDLCDHGQWLPWLEANCQIPGRTVRHYMWLARRESKIGNVADLTVREAIDQLAAEDEHEADLRKGQLLADNVRQANANLVNVFVAKCRELRQFAEVLEQAGDEDQQRALLKAVNKTVGKKWKLDQVKRWKKRTDEEAWEQGWQVIVKCDSGPDDSEAETSPTAAVDAEL